MSIANALNNAISGLTAASRGTELVSTNLANSLTPGYARRELELSPRIHANNGGGVHINGVNRIISNTVLSEFRLSSAAVGRSAVTYDFYSKIEAAIGEPQNSASLSAMMNEMEAALISASGRPDSETRLRAVFESAGQLVKKINAISATIQDTRTNADRLIDKQVDALNEDLNEVSRLNRLIIIEQANNRDSSSLEDARRGVIDRIASVVPVREVPRENGRIALFTQNGAVLLDGKAPTLLGFEATGALTPDIDQNSEQLGRLSINGEFASSFDLSLFAGGSLFELFQLRDDYTITAQAGIDSIARELHDRFADSAIDTTIPVGGSGLFVDLAGPFDPANERGLASRLRITPTVDPTQGGQLWRIRDGLNAAAPGDVGDGSILDQLRQVMAATEPFRSDSAPAGLGSVATLTSTLLSDISSQRISAETLRTHDVTLLTSLQDALLADGVDSDRELQMLLQLEKSYAANAKVIQAVNDMLDQILRI
ncbi:MAG: flagellar hook-associated protein FlgK [Paracoccus sp. (in: a-proteobacteria)]|nr:flagellar hook-associated protein FlgK [Paracoccus sp. (in: a-proteobacteria)]